MQRNTTFAAISRHYGLPARLQAPDGTLQALRTSIKVQADLLESYAAAYMYSYADPFEGLRALSTWFNGIFAAIFPFYHDQLVGKHGACVPAPTPNSEEGDSSAPVHPPPDPPLIPHAISHASSLRSPFDRVVEDFLRLGKTIELHTDAHHDKGSSVLFRAILHVNGGEVAKAWEKTETEARNRASIWALGGIN